MGRIKATIRMHRRVRVLPFHSRPMPRAARTGKKTGLPLKSGMSQSKNGLTSDRLTKKNRCVSRVCSQCIDASVDGNWKLEIGFVFYARPHPDPLPRGEGIAIARFCI